MNIRTKFLLLFLWPVLLLVYALYMQHVEFLDPCPLCIFQRMAYLVAALLALPGMVLHSRAWIVKTLLMGYGLAALLGAGIAAWHVRLQNLPPESVPDCGPGLEYLLDTLPLWHVLQQVFQGSGECAEISWVFLGLSMPAWSLVMFLSMAFTAFWLYQRTNSAR